MKLNDYILAYNNEGEMPLIIQTNAPYLIGQITVPAKGFRPRTTTGNVRIPHYNVWVSHVGFLAPTEWHGDIAPIMDEMARYAYEEVCHRRFHEYGRMADDREAERAIVERMRAERKERQKKERFDELDRKLFKRPGDE